MAMTDENNPPEKPRSNPRTGKKTNTIPLRGQPTQQPLNPPTKHGRISDANKQRIIEAYGDGLSITSIARTFRHSKQTIRKTLREADIEIRVEGSQAKITGEQLEECLAKGWTPRQIADEFDVDIRTIHHRLRKLGKPAGRPAVELPTKEVLAAYEAGATVQELADIHGTSYQAVRSALVAAGLTIRSGRRPLVSKYKLADYCRRGWAVGEIAAETGVGRKAIARYLADAGLKAADKRPGRERPASAELGGVL